MKKRELSRFRKLLDEQRDEILKKARKTLAEESAIDVDALPDEIDFASFESTQSLIFRLRDREKFLLKKIDKSLQKIESGEFGVCEECGEDIPARRLEARPVTTMCVRCKEEQERLEKRFG